MKCIECDHMACKVFSVKAEKWTGFCLNECSTKYHTTVIGDDNCIFMQKLF